MMVRRKFSKEFKVAAIQRLQGGQPAAEVARALEVHPSELHRWRHELDEHGERAFQGVGKKRVEEIHTYRAHHVVLPEALTINVNDQNLDLIPTALPQHPQLLLAGFDSLTAHRTAG